MFGFWDVSMQKTKPKMLKKQKQLRFVWLFEILIDHIHSKKQKTMFFLVFPFQNQHIKQKKLGKPKNTSQNQTFSQKLFFLFCLSFCFVFPGVVCFSRCGPSCSSFRFQAQTPPQRVSKYCFFLYKYGCRHYWLHERWSRW